MDGYSAHHIYLGEWAQQLQHMQKYEIPNMKKKVGRMKAGLPELRRKAGTKSAQSDAPAMPRCMYNTVNHLPFCL
jgi:hypothetical protein|eukprot:COSAG02_NODE_1248_length_13631_cov_11.854197_5_plen_75_part_00